MSASAKVQDRKSVMEKDKRIEILLDMLRINTENDREAEVAEYISAILAEHGIASELVNHAPGRASLVAEISNGEGKTLALSGHMDVVSAGDSAAWKHPPFAGDVEDGVIWGRGASDMKSGLAALLVAFIELKESGRFRGSIRLMATAGEEVGELGSKHLTDAGYADGIDALLIAEPCNVGVMYAHKGSLNYKVISKGSSAHSSMPELGSNAVEHLMTAMEAISNAVRERALACENATLGRTFHNITIVRGATQVNSIPDHAEFEANARTIPEFDNHAVMAEVERVIGRLNKEVNCRLEAVMTADQPPVLTRPDSLLVKTILEVANGTENLGMDHLLAGMGKVIGKDLSQALPKGVAKKIAPIVASGTTDAAQFIRANPNMELAVYGPGMPMLNHRTDERLPLDQYLNFTEAYQKIIENYSSRA